MSEAIFPKVNFAVKTTGLSQPSNTIDAEQNNSKQTVLPDPKASQDPGDSPITLNTVKSDAQENTSSKPTPAGKTSGSAEPSTSQTVVDNKSITEKPKTVSNHSRDQKRSNGYQLNLSGKNGTSNKSRPTASDSNRLKATKVFVFQTVWCIKL